MVGDRYFSLASRFNDRVYLDDFIKIMLDTYNTSVQKKLKLVFRIFDFKEQQKISKEEVFLILSYIPFYSSKEDNN